MKLSDFNKLRKLMQQSTSDSDGETLNAIRAANALLKRYDKTWEDVFGRLVQIEIEAAEEEPEVRVNGKKVDRELDDAFKLLFDTVPKGASFLDFVNDLYEQWTNTNFLSGVQRESIIKAAKRNWRT